MVNDAIQSAAPAADVLLEYSLEMTPNERHGLNEAASRIPAKTQISVPYLPADSLEERVEAAKEIRRMGFEPMPHLSARRIASEEELSQSVRACIEAADVDRFLLIAGDPDVAAGPFEETLQLLKTGIFEANGVRVIGIGGHPDGHPAVDEETLWKALELKVAEIENRGMEALIVTQFGFDAESMLSWLAQLRRRGITAPVRIGVPGPTSIKRLLKFAKMCGVGATTSVLKKYGISLTKLMGNAGPDKLVDTFRSKLSSEHGAVYIHYYPFGGITPTVEWVNRYSNQ
jgi:methylenetetrahydrofolate reductase (NADPH)